MVDDIKNTLTNDRTAKGIAALAEWKLAAGAEGWNGERLFQAARFVTEMEYQHLVFEEFGRKIQPAIDPFHVYHTETNPAISAEFAHAVYRFGHSMLTETISRTNENGGDNSIPLLEGFLNPPSYNDGGAAGALTSEQAAASIIMGMSDQSGNELDEFVTGTLRNNLLGLPLDLATLNIARAREAGVPPLNEVRRQLNDATGDAALAPYGSWADFGQALKHSKSLVNFVAAYGTHPSITSATTVKDKRAAAQALIEPVGLGVSPEEGAYDFIFGTGAWAGRDTGLNSVDLWIGGLAEKTNLFGGLLGSTFNYVFESQMTELQNGDRFYYLARLPGTNLRAQIEGNSFAEMIMRNTSANSLKADVFSTSDCKFQMSALSGTAAGFTQFGPIVADDPASDCNESALLLRKADGTIQYREFNTEDPAGINGQSVYNGVSGVDRIVGGNDNDTILGNDGDDILEGQGGSDVTLGGAGDDRITDLAGDDVPKGGPGNDYINAGPGLDIIMGGDGQDFTNGGANDNETFGGEGSDFIQSGDGSDTTFGDGGDDWIQGGSGQDLLIGDHGAPFFDDPAQTAPGHDVMIGQVGENDYDAEGGDDIMSANAAVDRYAGSAGFDWAIHQYDTVGADDDMRVNAAGVPLPVNVTRDRWQEVEGISGSSFNDILRGDDIVPSEQGGGGFSGCDVLDQAGINRISGLGAVVPTPTTPLGPIEAASAMGQCPLEGLVWGDGNVLLGGLGSDILEGRGADDILDGDRYIKVRISVRDNAGVEIGTTDLMERTYQAGNPKTLAADVAAGVINPGNLVIVREVITPTAAQSASDVDTARFSDLTANYTVTTTGGDGTLGSPGSVTTVAHTGGTAVDGIDTLRNIERLVFSDTTVPAAPSIGTAVAGDGQATVNFTPPAGLVTSFSVTVLNAAGTQVGALRTAPADATSLVVTGLTNGTSYRFQVAAVNAEGTGPASGISNAVTPTAATVPVLAGPPVIGTPVAANASATVNWSAPAAVTNAPPVTGYVVRTFLGTSNTLVSTTTVGNVTSTGIGSLTNGTGYTFDVAAVNSVGTGPVSARSAQVTPAAPLTAPAAPTIGTPVAGNASATVNWTAPAPAAGAAPVTGYVIRTFVGTSNTVFSTTPVGNVTTSVITGLTNGTAYSFDVAATSASGAGAVSARSAQVTPVAPVVTTAPAAPTIGASTAGNASVTVRWTAPANTGGSAITGYTVRRYVGTSTVASSPITVGNVTSTVITGLTNGTSYRFDVAAINAVGTGAFSGQSTAVTPTAGTTADTVAPTISARVPATSARSVSQTANLTVTFSEPVTGVSATTLTLRQGTTAVAAVVTYDAATRTATLNPNATLAADRTFTVSATAGIRDVAGNALAATTWTFITGPAPTITATSPTAGATAIRRNANVTATFSEPIIGVSTSTVRITNALTGAAVTTASTFSSTTRVLTINPGPTLTSNTQYRVTITGGNLAVRDAAGNPVVTRTWVFTTGTGL